MLNRLTILGAVGSMLVAASSWWVGAVPVSFRSHPPVVIDRFSIGGGLPRGVYYAGLILLTVAWVRLGRYLLRSPTEIERGPLVRLILIWALPILAAMPVASRDVWAYAAQGQLDNHGLDPYQFSPTQLHGVFRANVSDRWIHSTSPYGPLWLLIGRAVALLCGGHIQIAVFLLRLPALVGLLLLVGAVPRIALRLRRRGDTALWLVAASPLTLVIGLGGSHNDLLMAGLAAVGVLAAVSTGSPLNTLALGAGLTAAAAAVKSPAFIAVAFVVPLWLVHGRTRRSERSIRGVVLAAAVAACSALVSFGTFTLLARHGLGWAGETNSAAQANWLSLPSSAAMLVRLATGHSHGATTVDDAMRHWRAGGLALAAVLLVGLWLAGIRCALRRSTRRIEPIAGLAVALLVIVVLGPSVQPWYLGWSLPFAALSVLRPSGNPRRRLQLVGGLTGAVVALSFIVRPDGRGVQMQPLVLLVLAAGVLAGVLTVRGIGSESGDDDADGARAGVGAHRRRDLGGHQLP